MATLVRTYAVNGRVVGIYLRDKRGAPCEIWDYVRTGAPFPAMFSLWWVSFCAFRKFYGKYPRF